MGIDDFCAWVGEVAGIAGAPSPAQQLCGDLGLDHFARFEIVARFDELTAGQGMPPPEIYAEDQRVVDLYHHYLYVLSAPPGLAAQRVQRT